MGTDEGTPRDTSRIRREPPPLLTVTVADRIEVSPRLIRLTLSGTGAARLAAPGIAASIRLLIPAPPHHELVIPAWNGNEFLLPDGERPILRTFTPLRHDPDAATLDIEIVRHPGGAVSGWAETARPGAVAAISGPARGYEPDPATARLVAFADETAQPALSQVLESLAPHVVVDAHVETEPGGVAIHPARPTETITHSVRRPGDPPGSSLVAAVHDLTSADDGLRVWAAGEAASMQAIRTHLHGSLGVPRSHTNIRGYWKPAR